MSRGWIGVDLDGTLAHYDHWRGANHIGRPIEPMMERVRAWLADGIEVRIFTARVYGAEFGQPDALLATETIREWLADNGLPKLPITCTKDYGMVSLWDDRAAQVIPNTGRRADGAA